MKKYILLNSNTQFGQAGDIVKSNNRKLINLSKEQKVLKQYNANRLIGFILSLIVSSFAILFFFIVGLANVNQGSGIFGLGMNSWFVLNSSIAFSISGLFTLNLIFTILLKFKINRPYLMEYLAYLSGIVPGIFMTIGNFKINNVYERKANRMLSETLTIILSVSLLFVILFSTVTNHFNWSILSSSTIPVPVFLTLIFTSYPLSMFVITFLENTFFIPSKKYFIEFLTKKEGK